MRWALILLSSIVFAGCTPRSDKHAWSGQRLPEESQRQLITLEGDPACQAPRRISGRVPSYPPNQALQKVSGMAEVEFTVDVDGKVVDLIVTEASHPKFGAYLADAVKRWAYEPAACSDGPRAARMRQRYVFGIYP